MTTESKALFALMVSKASTLPVDELKRVLLEDAANPTFEVGVFESLLDALEAKVTEQEFKSFCDEVNNLY